MISSKSRAELRRRIDQENAWRDEINQLIGKANWTTEETLRVEELASLLEFSDEDRFWRS